MKTKRQIILETAKKYTSKNRSIFKTLLYTNGESCAYIQGENKCAVGRCLKPSSVLFSEKFNVGEGVTSLLSNYIVLDKELKPSYRGHSIDFWDSLQRFHDWKENWNKNGLTARGKKVLNRLLNTWGEK